MAVTMKQVRAALDVEEPDYPAAAEALGTGALTHCRKLAGSADALLASKATYLASLVGGSQGAEIVATAARHADPEVRVASAAAARNLTAHEARGPLAALLADSDTGVRKTALRAVGEEADEDLQARVRHLLDAETDPHLRGLARDALMRASSAGHTPYPPVSPPDESAGEFGAGQGGGSIDGTPQGGGSGGLAPDGEPGPETAGRTNGGSGGSGGGGSGSSGMRPDFSYEVETDGQGGGDPGMTAYPDTGPGGEDMDDDGTGGGMGGGGGAG